MPDTRTFLQEPRRRNLAVLAAIAVVSIVLAVLALAHQAAETGTQSQQEMLFPNLADRIRHITRIHIDSRQYGAFDIVFDPEKGWVIPQHANYRASFEQMRSTVVGLSNLETLAPKTARPGWYGYIGVDAPPKGSGMLIQLLDDKGTVLAALIMGKTTDIGDTGGAVGLYVRKPDDAQSWLVKSVFEPKSNPADWLDKNTVDVDRARIAEVDVTPISGPAFTIKRDNPEAADFTIANLPQGREEIDPSAADAVATAITGFAFDDAKAAGGFDFSAAPRFVTKTFDGLTVTVQVLPENQTFWATVYATGANPQADREARAIDAHTDGWAYKLPTYKGQLFMTTLDSLLKPLAAKK
jgi:hypothetical protein